MKYLDTLLEKYQIRKTKDQKTAFLSWAQEEIQKMGYECRVEEYEKDMFKCRNLIVGNPEEAKVIYTAHYDTQPVMPLPNMVFPKNTLATLGAQLPIMLIMVVLCFAGVFTVNRLVPADTMLSFFLTEGWLMLSVVIFLGLLFFGPANKHTANDNTSGTACLMEMMSQLPEDERKHAAFIFFDQEEKGKVGSLEFAKKYPKIKKKGYIMNLDCIGDGKHMLIVAPKKTPDDELTALEQLFQSRDGFIAEAATAKHASYNSDQRSFSRGYAIAALHLHPQFGLHLKRIHTKRDTICEKANLQFVIDGCLKLLKQKAEEN
ncbi:MAG: M28 family peptidase [Clostridia bacterium]|nr:M28 family peptidase [Clostridia bacterium]